MDASQTTTSPVHETGTTRPDANSGAMGAVYGLGFIGAGFYYIQAADSFWEGVLGFGKALVWPAFLVYELLNSLNA